MIHPSELRIGNKFSKFNQETGTWQLITIGVKDIECAVDFPKVFAAFYEPIKLSPYYLEKLGFEKNNKYEYAKGRFMVYCAPSGNINVFLDGFIVRVLRHLHQLQNLHRDLSGTELDVPEKL